MSIIRDEWSFNSTQWIYTSAVMARRLELVINNRRIRSDSFQDGDVRCAKLLFGSLLEACRESSIDEALTQNINLHALTVQKKDKSKAPKNAARQEPESLIKAFSEFVKNLKTSRPLKGPELKIAGELRSLFLRIYKAGGTSTYERYMALEFPHG